MVLPRSFVICPNSLHRLTVPLEIRETSLHSCLVGRAEITEIEEVEKVKKKRKKKGELKPAQPS